MDTKLQSFFRGRLGAALLAAGSVALQAYGIGETEQNALVNGGSLILCGGAAVLAVVSKVREHLRK